MGLITINELKTKAPVEVVSAIVKLDDNTINTIIEEAEGEMKTHLAMYDVETIFSSEGLSLPGIKPIVKHLKGMVIQEVYRIRGSNHGDKAGDDAIIFLEKVNNNKITLELPLAPEETEEQETTSSWDSMGSDEAYNSDF